MLGDRRLGCHVGTIDESRSSLRQLADDEPQRHDLFIGLVAPIGSSREDVLSGLADKLGPFGYDVERVHLAGLLSTIPADGEPPLPERNEPGYYKARMDAGDRLRDAAGDWSALAALAVAHVTKHRKARRADGTTPNPTPVAYIFDSLKHPREAALLRSVYGPAFWLVSIVQDISERKHNLTEHLARQEGQFDQVPESRAVDLIARDEADPDAAHGQHVRDVFSAADFFLPVGRGIPWQAEVERLLRGLFDSPFLSPSADEEAMRHAQAAALRSAAVGRQVGAVIVPEAGTPYLLGTNEVPKPGGGQYREGDQPDHRDFQSGADPNPAYTDRVIRELMNRLAKAGYFTPERNSAGGDAVLKEATTPDDDGRSVLDGARAKSLIEFTRCLHAEQAAIVNAARAGVSIAGSRLFTTTFPCHECTKFIIGAGIIEVQYIEPYPKSLAGELYRDLIDTVPPLHIEASVETTQKVPFRPFVGFAPSRYDEVFRAGRRRQGAALATFVPADACPIGRGWSEVAVTTRQDEVVVAVASVVQRIQAEASAVTVGDHAAGEPSEGAGQASNQH